MIHVSKCRTLSLVVVVLTFLIQPLRATSGLAAAASAPSEPSIIVEHVNILSMVANRGAQLDQTIVIRGSRIESIAPSSRLGQSPGSVDGRGKWLLPGLTDMHVHMENVRMIRLMLKSPDIPQTAIKPQDIFLPYIANGVVQVMDLQGMSEAIGRRDDIEAGRIIGPHVVIAAMIDGSPPAWPIGTTRVAVTPEDGRQAVRDAAAEGYDAIKVYSKLSLETFTAIVAEARSLGLPVVGHIPERHKGTTAEFFQPGFRMVAHAEEFALCTDTPRLDAIPDYIAMMKKNGAWLTSTLSLDERLVEETRDVTTLQTRNEIRVLHPLWRDVVLNHNPYSALNSPERIASLEKVLEFNRALVRAFIASGIPVVAGTDSMVPGVVPGYSMHDELEALTRAGMTPVQALEAATRLPCEWLGNAKDRGTIEVGKRADAILLDADPTTNISNTRRISAVILNGQYYSADTLQHWMQFLAQR